MKSVVMLGGLVVLLALLTTPGPVRASELDAFLARVEAKARPVKSFICRFTQERHLAIFAKPVMFSGRLAMSRPRQLRWEFLEPVASVLALQGTAGLRCAGGRSQRFELAADPVMASVIEQMWAWMDGSYKGLDQAWQIEFLPHLPGLSLIPRSAGVQAVMKTVRIAFDRGVLRPARIEIVDSGGDRTVLTFSDYSLNPVLADSLFRQCDPALP